MNAPPTPMSMTFRKPPKQIHVSCAIIQRDNLVLAVQRGSQMSLPLKWEFPGGKIEKDETPKTCLKRELLEELDVHVQIGDSMDPVSHAYQTFRVTLYPFLCTIESGSLYLREHAAFLWLPPAGLRGLDWAEADVHVLEAYLKLHRLPRGESL